MKILVIRFRQMGDAILSTCIFNTIRRNFPEAETYFVLNDRIAPLFEGHEAVDHVITFTDEERHSTLAYLKKVWKVVNDTHFDVIIDMRSTMNTIPFSLFSPRTTMRIGLKKAYTHLAFNRFVSKNPKHGSIITHDLDFVKPLAEIKPLEYDRRFTLDITDGERNAFRRRMADGGIDFAKPVMLVGVTAKIESKTWSEDSMVSVIDSITGRYPDMQLIFNYAPGREEDNARRIYSRVEDNSNIFIGIQARNPRELAAMSGLISVYFGNEGGARHIVHACGKPSFVICSPIADKATWLPQDNVPSEGIAASDIAEGKDLERLTPEEIYALITPEIVKERLFAFLDGNIR